MATLENVNAKLIPSNYIKAGQMEYVIWNTSFGKVGIKSRQSYSHFSWNILNSYSKDQDLSIRKNRNFETSHSSCVDLCSVLKLQKLGSVLRYRLFLYHVIFKHKHTHRHIERKPKRSKAVGGGSVWSNPRRRFSKEECRTSNT